MTYNTGQKSNSKQNFAFIDLAVGRWFSPGTPASSTNIIVESGVKHHKPNQSIARNICINGVFFNITFDFIVFNSTFSNISIISS
jgi:hypothetical protein